VEVVVAADPVAPKGSGTLYVLAIGINDYPDERLKLECARPDAQLLVQSFRSNSRRLFQSVETRLLLDREATRANILAGLTWLAQNTHARDVAVVFYAGHGDFKIEGQFYLVPVDVDLRSLSQTGVSGGDLKKTLGELECPTLLFLDACYAGSFDAKTNTKKTRTMRTRALPDQSTQMNHDQFVNGLYHDAGLVVFCGASKEQEAAEENGHGFFTQAVTEGLSGKADLDGDGQVMLIDLHRYVLKRVKRSNPDQEPTIGIPTTIRSSLVLSQP
jgi:uncharacterized caspase-like protein